MRRLRTVVIEGFKTFADPTVVELAEGMTAIVGPNGCGKSNLVDAVAWAIGSRSWKTLRGGDMEDIVYHGNETTPPSERAIVRLVFLNPDRALPVDWEEVEVARELHRVHRTKAYINRVEARVKDVQTLLADTGLVGGFSLVRQGMVDRMILSPPEKLGRWIEEAADISGFPGKRKEALGRLEKVRQNLAQAEVEVEALRKERRKVRERAERARERSTLSERAGLLASQVATLERRAIEGDILALDDRKGTLPAEVEDLERRRVEQVLLRTQIEELLAGKEKPLDHARDPEDPPALLSPERAAEKAGSLEAAGAFTADLGRILGREGPPAWPKVKKGIRRTIEILRELEEGDVPAPPKSASAHEESQAIVAHLRLVNQEIDTIDQRRTEIARTLAVLGEERARLEERLGHLGPPIAPAVPPPPGANVSQLRNDLERLERDLARIGPVDETAQAQEEELGRRIETRRASLKDLREAQSQLLRFLEELDLLAAQVFHHTLQSVENRFEKHFKTLFGGGHVRLRLAPRAEGGEGEKVLDLGDENHSPPVEIQVKLPGKGQSALTLLSGGERSLTGIALILALAAGDDEKKVGRLLILDEVDAALDQANAVRFAKLVAELSKTHQILCVTHCGPTMQEASRLVGITTGSAQGTTAVFGMALPDRDRGATASQAAAAEARS
jgi:chromosome segregation ATPase